MNDLYDIYDGIVEKIQDAYSACNPAEQLYLLKILEELSISGESETLEKIWLADFTAVPVSIDTFISDPQFLGSVNRNGEAVYPFWKQTLRNIFDSSSNCSEIILSGATRIGKTSTAVIIASYMLYRLMLYRNPHEYFHKKEISKFTIAFANLTKELASSVAYREYNDTLAASPWFMDHGKKSASDNNFYYIPEGNHIEIIASSDSAHLLGKQIWCLTGDTTILTDSGCITLEEAAGTYQNVMQYVDGQLIPTCALVQQTGQSYTTIRIELEDGSIIEGTPDHKVMLTDGSYKALKDLTSSDDLLTLDKIKEVDK